MTTLPESASLSPFLPDVYRFALLMTGEAAAAAAVLRRTVEHAVRAGIADLRDVRRVKRWLFAEARRQCAGPTAAPAATKAAEGTPQAATEAAGPCVQLTARFATVPAAERGALILFYLYLFDPLELSEVLEISSKELAPLLTRGREMLGPADRGPVAASAAS